MKKLPVLLIIAFVSGAVISIALADSWRFAVTDDSRAVASIITAKESQLIPENPGQGYQKPKR